MKPLLQLIPGMFIFDFLRRNSMIRKYSRFYLPPRVTALDAARDLANGLDREAVLKDAREKAGVWLDTHGLTGSDVRQSLFDLVELLIEHDLLLLRSEGETVQDLVRRAYGSRGAYRSFLDRLAERERAFIGAVSEAVGEEEASRQLQEEQDTAEAQREKEMDAVYL